MRSTEEYIENMLKKGVTEQFRSVATEDIEQHVRERDESDTLQYNWLPLLVKIKQP